MLTRLTIRNFKLFGEVDVELDNRVVLIGPNRRSGSRTATSSRRRPGSHSGSFRVKGG
jgi:hypothetical protein